MQDLNELAGYDMAGPTPEQLKEVEAAKKALHSQFSQEELIQLRRLADRLRNRPMNRKARRAMASRIRRKIAA